MALELYSTPLYSLSTLKAYYRFEGDSTDAKDSHNGSDSTISYNASYGKFGQGASLNGSSSRISITDSTDFKPTNGAYTFSCWFNYQSADGDLFQSYSDSGNNYHGIEITVSSTGFTIVHADYPAIDYLYSVGSPFTASAWNLIVVTYDGTNTKVYANGILNNSGNMTNPSYAATNYVEIGRRNNGSSQSNYYGGYIDEAAFYLGYAWTLTDVQNYYNGTWGGIMATEI